MDEATIENTGIWKNKAQEFADAAKKTNK